MEAVCDCGPCWCLPATLHCTLSAAHTCIMRVSLHVRGTVPRSQRVVVVVVLTAVWGVVSRSGPSRYILHAEGARQGRAPARGDSHTMTLHAIQYTVGIFVRH